MVRYNHYSRQKVNKVFYREGLLAPRPTPQAGGPPLVGCPRLLIQFIRSYPPYRRPFLCPQPEDAPCSGDRDHNKNINPKISVAGTGAFFFNTSLILVLCLTAYAKSQNIAFYCNIMFKISLEVQAWLTSLRQASASIKE